MNINQQLLENLIKNLLLPKADLIINELKHEYITLGEKPLGQVQEVLLHNAIQGALITGMKTTVEELLKRNNESK